MGKFKICNDCKENKSLNEFYWDKSIKRYKSKCKICESRRRGHTPKIESDKEREKEKILNQKKCKICNETKDLKNFKTYIIRGKSGFYKECNQCKFKKYREKHPIKPKKKKNLEIDTERGWKICFYCEQQKMLKEFPFSERNRTKNNKYRGYSRQCLDCKRKREKKLSKTEKFKERRRKYYRKRNENDISFKIMKLSRSRIRVALHGIKKSAKTEILMGCSKEFIKEYFKSLFKEGMNFNNHGKGNNKWVIDHILPCELFNLSDEKQQKVCFHYTNMQPLWWTENQIKKDTLPDGRKAQYLTQQEKLDYLAQLGYDFR